MDKDPKKAHHAFLQKGRFSLAVEFVTLDGSVWEMVWYSCLAEGVRPRLESSLKFGGRRFE